MPHDSEASLRDELTAKIAGAQADIESKLIDLRNALGSAANGVAITQAESQLRGLTLLQKRVDGASPASLAAIRAEVAASVAATQAFVQQSQTGASVQAREDALLQASAAARGSVNDFMHAYYDEHKFDRYLQFASVEDQEEYRRREQERKQAIDKALAEHTPEGNLQANKLAIEQLKDAGAHGADKSPDYRPTLDKLEHDNHDLSQAISGTPSQRASKDAAASLDPETVQLPPNGVSPEVIAQLRAARASAASTPFDVGSVAAPTTTGAARSR